VQGREARFCQKNLQICIEPTPAYRVGVCRWLTNPFSSLSGYRKLRLRWRGIDVYKKPAMRQGCTGYRECQDTENRQSSHLNCFCGRASQ